MKQLLFTLLCLFGIQFSTWAQNPITMTSTAKECIAFIEKMANTRPPTGEEIFKFSFTGTTFTEISESKDSRSTRKVQYIDWIKFVEFNTFEPEDELITVSFTFNTDLVTTNQFWTKEHGIFSRDKDYDPFLIFSFPVSQQSKIPELKIAANRLAQLAKSSSSTVLQVTIPPDALNPLPGERKTKDFILAKMSAYKRSTFNEDFRLDYDGFKVNTLFYTNNNQPAEEAVLEFKDLKGITIVEDDIIFTGKTTITNLRTRATVTSSDLIYNIKVDTPQSEKDKLLKALKHYVWMKGVDLVKDDLFGD